MNFDKLPQENKDQEKFHTFIKKDKYCLIKSDTEALEMLKDKEDENSELKFIRGNHVFTGEVDQLQETLLNRIEELNSYFDNFLKS